MMYPGQQQSAVVQPHHAQALHNLPSQFPNFFTGFAPQSFQGVTVRNIEVPNILSRLLMKYIIEGAHTSRFRSIMYQAMSNNNFANHEFLKLVTTANCLFNALINRGSDQNSAFNQATHVAAAKWVVDYIGQIWYQIQPNGSEQQLYQQAKTFVDNFEQKMAAPAQQQPYYGAPPVIPGAAVQPTTGGLYDLFPQQTPYARNAPVGEAIPPAMRDFNEGVLSSPLLLAADDDQPPQATPVNEIIQTNTNNVVMNAAQTEQKGTVMDQHTQQVVPDKTFRTREVMPVLDVRNNVYFAKGRDIGITHVSEIEGPVNYEEHKKARLFNDERAWGLTALDTAESDNSLAAICAISTIPVQDGEIGDDIEIISSDQMEHAKLAWQPAIIDVKDHMPNTIRYELSRHMTVGTKTAAAICCFETSEEWVSLDEKYIEALASVSNIREIADGLAFAMKCEDQLLRTAAYEIDRTLTNRVYEVMNYELGIRGNLDSFTEDAPETEEYLKNEVNVRSHEYFEEQIIGLYKHIVEGLVTGSTKVNKLAVLTRATSKQFPFIIAGDCGEVTKTHTPLLYDACEALFDYTQNVNASLCTIEIHTIDSVIVRLFKTAFGDKFVLVRT